MNAFYLHSMDIVSKCIKDSKFKFSILALLDKAIILP
jgi:hypothetical protein